MSRTFRQSLSHAWQGLVTSWRNQPNFRIHLVMAALVLFLAAIQNKSAVEIALLVVMVTLVIVAELVNTAVEVLADIMHPRVHRNVEILKDVSAAAVLVASVGAVMVGVLLFFV